MSLFPTLPNVLLIVTDQQRAFQDWPAGWAAANLPSFARLQQNGVTFNNAFTNTSMCSPSRATLWTSRFPAETGVTSTGDVLPPSLPEGMTTLFQIMSAAGYSLGYCGKWHLGGNTPAPTVTPVQFGFPGWDAPDAGINLGAGPDLGAGKYNNDARFLGTATATSNPPWNPPSTGTGPSMLDFIGAQTPGQPFFLVASFVNPHDIGIAPFSIMAGYGDATPWSSLPITVPSSWNENLKTKPSAQQWFQQNAGGGDFDVPSWSTANQLAYVQFYAYLQTLVDADIMTLLDALDAQNLTESTLIVRIADHGEMGLAHGLVEKAFNAYEETLRIPMIFSCPAVFPSNLQTNALAGLVDVVPTLASIVGYSGTATFRGKDLGPVLEAPSSATVQDSILFTFDDTALGTPERATSPCAGQIRCLRTIDGTGTVWKYAAYFAPDALGLPFQYELYDLSTDPEELDNLASSNTAQLQLMNNLLVQEMIATNTMPPGVTWPTNPTAQGAAR